MEWGSPQATDGETLDLRTLERGHLRLEICKDTNGSWRGRAMEFMHPVPCLHKSLLSQLLETLSNGTVTRRRLSHSLSDDFTALPSLHSPLPLSTYHLKDPQELSPLPRMLVPLFTFYLLHGPLHG